VIFTDETGGRELCILIGGVSISLHSALTALLANLVMVIVLTSVLQGGSACRGSLYAALPCFLVRVCCMVLPNSMLPTLRTVLVG
jgi:hypothetical protein